MNHNKRNKKWEKNCPKENHADILEVTKIRQGVGVCVYTEEVMKYL